MGQLGRLLAHGLPDCRRYHIGYHRSQLDLTIHYSIKSAASTIAYGMVKYYSGNETGGIPGNLPPPYYWWECGGMMMTLIDYWYYTNDTTYNNLVFQAMQFQVGTHNDYMPANQSSSEGNDDQGFWAMAAMTAAETNFQNPPSDKPQWLALAQAVFNEQVGRWDNTTCGGGLRWQIYSYITGYTYKNSIANGCLFNLGARLAKYTGNDTYAQWSEKTWDWLSAIGLIDPVTYQVYDGTTDTENCSSIDHVLYTYNIAIYIMGAATMYNYTNGAAIWETRLRGLLNASDIYFTDGGIMYEYTCEPYGKCDTDQLSFKAYLSRWMAAATLLAPFTRPLIMPKLTTSAQAAAEQCNGGTDGVTCGLHWTMNSTWDGSYGVGQQMAALEVVGAMLIGQAQNLVTNSTGGTSTGNSNAGSPGSTTGSVLETPVTKGDRVGAGILTLLVVVGCLVGTYYMMT